MLQGSTTRFVAAVTAQEPDLILQGESPANTILIISARTAAIAASFLTKLEV